MTTDARYQVIESCADCMQRYFGDCHPANDGDKINSMPPSCPLLKVADMVRGEKVLRLMRAVGDYLNNLPYLPRDTRAHVDREQEMCDEMADALAALGK